MKNGLHREWALNNAIYSWSTHAELAPIAFSNLQQDFSSHRRSGVKILRWQANDFGKNYPNFGEFDKICSTFLDSNVSGRKLHARFPIPFHNSRQPLQFTTNLTTLIEWKHTTTFGADNTILYIPIDTTPEAWSRSSSSTAGFTYIPSFNGLFKAGTATVYNNSLISIKMTSYPASLKWHLTQMWKFKKNIRIFLGHVPGQPVFERRPREINVHAVLYRFVLKLHVTHDYKNFG